jgi:hypothetical protein
VKQQLDHGRFGNPDEGALTQRRGRADAPVPIDETTRADKLTLAGERQQRLFDVLRDRGDFDPGASRVSRYIAVSIPFEFLGGPFWY